MFSIYTSLYNLSNGFIDWKGALDNFIAFADELSIATRSQEDAKLMQDYIDAININKIETHITVWDIPLDTIDFDGKLKNLALQRCAEPFCILLDGDERIDIKDKNGWINYANKLSENNHLDAYLIPVIDLFNTDREYKSIGCKWYLHKNGIRLQRGIVDFARREDKINIEQSDTCELIDEHGSLCEAYQICHNQIGEIKKVGVKVWHLGWLDKEKRLKANAFWQPVWNNRAGGEVKNIIHSKEKLEKIEYFPHGLKLWYE